MFPIQAGVSCMWINDSQRLLLEHFDTIHNSPAQLYHSALPFSPSSSWLRECYSLELLQVARVVKGLSEKWEMYSRTALLNVYIYSLSYWNNTVAVGYEYKDILILDAITGSQTAILSGHTDTVRSVTFSSDGTSLVSGSNDKTVKLWDVQTGGVVRTFYGHTNWIHSVSISANHTMIASGSRDKTLHLWNIQMGECHKIIEHQDFVTYLKFSSTNPQCLISASGGIVQQWDTNGHKVGPTHKGYKFDFSPDGTQFILSGYSDKPTVCNTNSGHVVAKLHIANIHLSGVPCFSPDYKLVTVADARKIYVWDITGSNPHLVETFTGHTDQISSLAFSSPSTLISASLDGSVKFWKIGTSSTGLRKSTFGTLLAQTLTLLRPSLATPMESHPSQHLWMDQSSSGKTDQKSTPPTLALAKSTALKAKNKLIIPSDLPDGVVQTWGILTGLYKGSLQIPARDSHQSNTQLIVNKLIFVWYEDEKINIWDAEKGELLQTINVPRGSVKYLWISGDGTKIFCIYEESIQAWDIQTGELVGKVRAQDVDIETQGRMVAGERMGFEGIEGSKIWAAVWESKSGHFRGWDFGIPGSPPVLFSSGQDSPDRPHLNDNKIWEIRKSRMKDIVTGKVVAQLPRRFGKAVHAQWDGHYLVVPFESGEVVILDFSHVPL